MDDYLESSETIEKATEKSQNLVRFLRLDEFNLGKFVSKVSEFEADMNRVTETKNVKVVASDDKKSYVLGLK